MDSQGKPYSVQLSEESTQGLNFKMECKECKALIDVTKQSVTFNNPYKTKDGQSIFVTYLDCPVCGCRHYVQVDDRHTSELRKEVSTNALRLFAKRRKGKSIPEKQNSKFKKQRQKLISLRSELMKKYEGSMVTNTITGEEIELHFSIC